MKPISIVAYGSPALALAMLLLPTYVFIPAFYVQNLGLPLAWVGYVIVLSRLFDAVTDPLIGYLSDRTQTRMGRRKPWILAGTPIAIVSVVALFVPPETPSLAYFAVAMFALTLSWTMIILPYNAWGAELSGDYNERTRIAAAREGIGLLGTLVAASAPAMLTALDITDPRLHMMALAGAIMILLITGVTWALWSVHEPAPLTRKRAPWAIGFAAIAKNAPFRRLMMAYVLNAFANGLPATLFVLFVSHVIGAPDAYGPLLLAYFLSGLLTIPLWYALSRRIGKHRAWVFAMLLASSAFAFTPFVVGEGDLVTFVVISIISGVGVGADLVLPAAIQADVVDADLQATSEHRTGLFFALWALATKLSLALSGLALPVLAYWQFDATALSPEGKSLNTPEALFALSLLYAALPVAAKLVAIALMWNFPLDATHQRLLREKIEARL